MVVPGGFVNGNGDNAMPWWMKAIATIGAPAVIAIYLVYAMDRNQTAMGHDLTAVRENLALHASDATVQRQQLYRIERILQQICVNGAQTSADRMACFRVDQ